MATGDRDKAGRGSAPGGRDGFDGLGLPLPRGYEGERFSALDYCSDAYAGAAALEEAVAMRGASAFARDAEPGDFLAQALGGLEAMGIAELWAQSAWSEREGGRDVALEREAAELAEGDTIWVRRRAESRDGWGYAFFRADGRELPFRPYHDYDDMLFERALAKLAAGERLMCRVRDTACYGGTAAPADPDFDWRVYSCKVTVLRRRGQR